MGGVEKRCAVTLLDHLEALIEFGRRLPIRDHDVLRDRLQPLLGEHVLKAEPPRGIPLRRVLGSSCCHDLPRVWTTLIEHILALAWAWRRDLILS